MKICAVSRAVGLGVLVVCAFAQSPRDQYRAAYQTWRQADPELERDAAGAGPAFGERAGRMASEVAKYGAARSRFLTQFADDLGEISKSLEASAVAELPSAGSQGVDQFVMAESTLVARNIDVFANDSDRGIQQVRQALQREKEALDALRDAIAERKKAASAADGAAARMEQSKMLALGQARAAAAGLKQIATLTDRESGGWVEYYRRLAESAQAQAATPPSAGANAGAGANAAPRPVINSPRTGDTTAVRPLNPSITPVPMIRYTGAWTYPAANGLFHGTPPEFVDLVVHEENNHATGSLFARFKLPAGSAGDPELRFDFSGDFKASRNQKFELETSDNSKGTLELIPGPAFNLLEVNFQIDAKPGKIRQGNFVLVKK